MLIAVDHLWQGGRLVQGRSVRLRDGQVVDVVDGVTGDRRVHVLMPAATDVQVNGGGGVMVNSDPTPDGLRAVAQAHQGLGTGAILPTVITDAPDVLDAAAAAAIAVKGEPGQLGLHIEGPHINPAKRGTHAERFVRPFDDRTMSAVKRLRAAQVPVVVTLAPETVRPQDIAALRDLGAVVSMGHSAATAEQARAGITAGATMATHLFNAMPPLLHRAPGLAAAAILSDIWCGVIADGHHVAWDTLRIAIAARPHPRRMFLVSDAMATVGGPDHFTLYGQDIHVQDGALVNAEGSLAGAHTDMLTGLANVVRHAAVPLEDAVAMATDVPRAALGLAVDPGVVPGASGLVALDQDLQRIAL